MQKKLMKEFRKDITYSTDIYGYFYKLRDNK